MKVIPEEGEKHLQRWVFEARFVLWQAEEKNYSALVPWAFLICKQFHTIFRIKVYLNNSINWAGIFCIPRHATHLFMNTVFEAFCCTFDSQLRSRKTLTVKDCHKVVANQALWVCVSLCVFVCITSWRSKLLFDIETFKQPRSRFASGQPWLSLTWQSAAMLSQASVLLFTSPVY